MAVSNIANASIAATLASVQTNQKVQSAVAHLAKQVTDQEGQQAVQLIQAAAPTPANGGTGHTVDIMA